MPESVYYRALVHAALVLACVWSDPTWEAIAVEPDSATKAPTLAAAIDPNLKMTAQFRLPAGLKIELAAAEPLLFNPVAFCFDERGRIYVAETYRKNQGIEDNRGHMNWLDDDLAAQTVDDRLAFFKKHLGEKIKGYGVEQELIRLLEDRNGDGKFEASTVFADGFNNILDGSGAGVLARGGSVYYTCIPHLWLLRDTDGDGKADARHSLHAGYGVRVAFHGHDLHGLCFGPDGKLYYSIGDRGYHVASEGRTLAYPDRGAIFRCNPDGSQLEVVAYGLRNPQELAFDDFGNLFTADNNSDSGDKARWVHIVEGADSGWRMNYQYLRDRGPWNREKLWHLSHAGQAAYIVPPVAHVADGPSGLAYYPGIGLPDKYRGHFFLCDFRGGSANSGVRSFAVRPKGASFELIDSEQFAWSILATDCDFGPDGSFYISDWVEGWSNPGKGRIYRVFDPNKKNDPLLRQTSLLIAKGMANRPPAELVRLLTHADRRVRQAAQFALAVDEPRAIAALTEAACGGMPLLARLHAIWGLGQIGRAKPKVLDSIVALLNDPDVEARVQAAKVLGDARLPAAFAGLLPLLKDDSPRVRLYAALSLGKLGRQETIEPLLALLRDNDDHDPVLRHAGVMGLIGCGDSTSLLAHAADANAAVRMGVLLALRRLASPELARFLNDADPRLVEEAARAINDEPIDAATSQLAALIDHATLTEPTWRRVLNANFRLGESAQAAKVARVAAQATLPESARAEAFAMLADWSSPGSRDRVLGSWRPLKPRATPIAADAVRLALPSLLSAPDKVRQAGIQLAGRLGIHEVSPALRDLFNDRQRPAEARAEALHALDLLKDHQLDATLELALQDAQAAVRAEGARILARRTPARAVRHIEKVLAGNSIPEQQAALATLATVQRTETDAIEVDAIFSKWMTQLTNGTVPPELRLDLLAAVARRSDPALKEQLSRFEASRQPGDPLAQFGESLSGGDIERGRKIFQERTEASCVRCHKVNGAGGEVGPDLTKIGKEKARDYLLLSIVAPNQAIAKGFESVMLVLDDGKVVSGVLRGEDERQMRVMGVEGQLLTISKNHIDERASGKSPMPEDIVKKLSKADLRDLVEYLSSLQGP